MNSQQLNDIISRIDKSLDEHAYTMAFAHLTSLVEATSSSWEIKDEAKRLAENYQYIKRFALDGYADPSRSAMLADIAGGIRRLAVLVKRSHLAIDSNNIYFSTLRYQKLHPELAIASEIDRYITLLSAFNLSRYGVAMPQKSGGVTRRELELAEESLFAQVWIRFPFSEPEADALLAALTSETMPQTTKQLLIGALLLGGLNYFDGRRLELLADIYLKYVSESLSVVALCSLLLLLWHWRNEQLPERLRNKITHIADTKEGVADIRMALLQFIRTVDTARITREVNEELIPKMRKLTPELKKLSDLQIDEDFDPIHDENPQWNDLLRKSGLEEQIKRINDMQEEGADVMMSTFSHLKSFPFFNDVVNWFRPFDPDFSMLNSGTTAVPEQMLEVVNQVPMFCDSDKYSMVLSLKDMPPEMLKMMRQHMEAQNINFAESASGMYADRRRQMVANMYMQNLYRFFNLFRRKGDFSNPFAGNINLFEISELSGALNDVEIVEMVGALYLKYGYFSEALSVYNLLSEEEIFLSADMLQKVGYCRQKLGDYAGAIDAYSKSELLDGRNRWTLRRLAYCHKAMGNPAKALEYFNRLIEQLPDDINLILSAGHCQMELGNYSEAMNLYFKVEFLDENTVKTLRPIAWCALLSGNLDRAQTYFTKIFAGEAKSSDYINYGHFLMASAKPREAAEAYTKALEMTHRDFDTLKNTIESDMRLLSHLGIDPLLMQLVVDEVQSTMWK